MKTFAANIISNFAGKIYVAVLAILLIPVYIYYLGIESYGLVGFYGTLLGSIAILDFGLSTTLNREIAKAKAKKSSEADLRNLVFTLECIYWVIGFGICLIVVLLSNLISHYWIKADHTEASTIRQCIILMGLVIAFQWPVGLYHGGLMGLEKQVLFNIITVIMVTLRSLGVLIILAWISPTIQAFFIWQVAINFLYVIWIRFAVWKHLTPVKTRRQLSLSELKKIWRFAAGITSTGIVTFFLTQADKVLLSKILPLNEFAFYTLAYTISSNLGIFILPISLAVFPKFSGLVSRNQIPDLIKLYHLSCRLIATIIIPVSLFVIFFTPEILMVWLKNDAMVKNTTNLVRILVIGSMFNSILVIPYYLTLAFGWTRYGFYQNLVASIILFPLLFWWTHLYGAIGATFVWLSINVGATIISIPLIHNKILKGQTSKWYIKDNLIPFLFSFPVCLLIYFLYKMYNSHFTFNYFSLFILFGIICSISFLQFPRLKKHIAGIMTKN